jgi:ABC-type polysaccharide/polyol phosphate export permease
MLALFFLTPIWYELAVFTSDRSAIWLRRLNPMASIVNMYQDLMYRGVVTSGDFVLRTAVTAIAVFVIGFFVFQRYSARFGEEV